MSRHKPMTDEELAAIQGRLAAITQPPWKDMGRLIIAGDKDIAVAPYCRYVTREEQTANAEFIANAPSDISRLVDEVGRLNRVSRYLAARLSPLNGTRRKYIGATLEDGYGSALFLTREEAVQSWLDEANREVNDAE